MAGFHKQNKSLDEANARAADPVAFIAACEETYHNQLHSIARDAAKTVDERNIMLLSGPSASGKTTTANKLAEAFIDISVPAKVISLDDFYFGQGSYPRREDGTEDYETVHALDLELLRTCFRDLILVGESEFPIFDFHVKQRAQETKIVSLGKGEVIIVEGIHSLNPLIVEAMSGHHRKIYATAMDRFCNEEVTLKTNDLRFCRRIVRDCRYRNVPASETVDLWPYVCDGEFEYIKPYRTDCDYYINTAFAYEPGLYRPFLDELLAQMGEVSQTGKVRHIAKKLDHFVPIDRALVPDNAMICEFIGSYADEVKHLEEAEKE